MNCPTCKSPSIKAGNKVFPFCRQRCQLVDLGHWFNEDYRIAAEPADPDAIDEASANPSSQQKISSHAKRTTIVSMVLAIALTSAPTLAKADPFELGGWLGGRGFSSNSLLGYKDGAPEHPSLSNSVVFGVRFARPILPWLVPELELAISPTKTDNYDVTVFWVNPRGHLRFELLPRRRVRPFIVIGGGGPISLSTQRGIFDSTIVGDGYAGGGVEFSTERSFDVRFDIRASLMPGVDPRYTLEWDAGLGLSFRLGEARRRKAAVVTATAATTDQDGDGIMDADDKCIDRAEDPDGFEDRDGCPDIDNDLDSVLDIADKCTSVPETYNGFEDDDGCPDTVPPELEAAIGTIPGLLYAAQETEVRDSASASIEKLVVLMAKYPSVRLLIMGHTDDVEATPKGTLDKDSPPDVDSLSEDLSMARAEAVKQALVGRGIVAARIETKGLGRTEPVSDNATPRGRLANRRVEIRLFVPQR
jgi:OmpA-OmpF porin, OOP family